MMVIDGAAILGERVYCQVTDVEPNTKYALSVWFASIIDASPGILEFSINNQVVGNTVFLSDSLCEWRQFFEIWDSGNAEEATICLLNQNTEPFGNDFAIDDIELFEVETTAQDTTVVVVQMPSQTIIDTAICEGSFFTYQGIDFPPNTTEVFAFTSQIGCDSLVQLQIGEADTVFIFNRIDTLCPGDTLFFEGLAILQDTTVCETISFSASCDSIICTDIVFLTETALAIDVVEPSCFGELNGALTVSPQAGRPPFSYQWSSGATEPTANNLASGNYSVTVLDSKGCQAIRSVPLGEPDLLILEADSTPESCFDSQDGQIVGSAIGGTPAYEYALGLGGYDASTTFANLATGPYTLTVKDLNECLATTMVVVEGPDSLTLSAGGPYEVELGEDIGIELSSNELGPFTYIWSNESGLDCTQCPNPSLTPTDSTSYSVTIVNEAGCEASASFFVDVIKNYEIFVPNVFTPNGDGFNDNFEIFGGSDVASIQEVIIFDRWGRVVYQADDCLLGDRSCFWDGGALSGDEVANGVYVYLIEVAFIDGFVKRVSGDLTVVR